MMKRNGSAMIGGCVVVIVAAIASCSFPTYNITVTGGSGGASASSGSVGSVGGGGAGATTTSSSGGGGASSTTSTTTASSASGSSSSTGTGLPCESDGGPCDCDNDKSLALSCGTGTDCNDDNPLVHPGQAMFFKDKIANTAGDYDYNCNGSEDYEVTKVSTCVGVLVAVCDTTTVGWKGAVPGCGVSAQIGTCQVVNLTCVDKVTGTQPQKCH